MYSSSASTSGFAIFSILSLSSGALAQLLGCDAVKCPLDDYRTPQCEVGNATLKAIGIANFTTSLDSQPLTWTLGLEELNGTQPTFDRNFYLGTPSSLKLNSTTGGCALFFEGVSANLTTSKGNQLGDFTCSDALAKSCISDLIAQAESNFEDIQGDTSDESKFCNKLRDSLVNKPPSTCNGLQGTWGNIVAKPISSNSTASPVEQSQCHPTTGKDYNLTLIASIRNEASSRNLSALAPILNAITPVMTVFRNNNETAATLSCLKLVDEQANQTVDTAPKKDAGTMLSTPVPLFSVLAAVAVFLVL